MARVVAVKCKTRSCDNWLQVAEVPHDTARGIHFVLRLEEQSRKLTCPSCEQEHEYSPSDKKLVELNED